MLKKSLLLLTLALPAFLTPPAAPAADLPPATQWIPQEVVAFVEISDPKALLEPLLKPELAQFVDGLPAYQKQKSTPQFWGFLTVVARLEAQLGTDWRTALRTLLGGNLTFALGPTGETLLCVDTQDEKMLGQLQEILRAYAVGSAAKANQPDTIGSTEYRGVTTWSFALKETHAIVGNRLLLANRPQALNAALDLRADPKGQSFASSAAYRAAREALGKDAVAIAWLDLHLLKKLPKVQQALEREMDPLRALLTADTKEAADKANWLALGVYVKDDTLTVKVVTDSKAPAPTAPTGFAVARQADEGILPNLTVPGNIAGLSLYRDLHGFYAAKNELFPERTSGLIFFENMMGIYFSGLDLTEQVLGETKPEIRLVVASQKYDPALGTPAVQLPAFAAVLRLRHPQTFGDVAEEAWQKALGMYNFTSGQKAQPGLVIDRVPLGDTKLTVAAFRPPAGPDKTGINSRYNFRPTLAHPDEYLILSSTDGLAKDVIDALKKESAHPPKANHASHSLLEIDGAGLQAILATDREPLVQKNMVDKGHSHEEAEGEVGLLLTILDAVKQARLNLGYENGHAEADVSLTLRLPATPRAKTTAANGSATSLPARADAKP